MTCFRQAVALQSTYLEDRLGHHQGLTLIFLHAMVILHLGATNSFARIASNELGSGKGCVQLSHHHGCHTRAETRAGGTRTLYVT